MSDQLSDAYLDLAACSGWNACCECLEWFAQDHLVVVDGQAYCVGCALPVLSAAFGVEIIELSSRYEFRPDSDPDLRLSKMGFTLRERAAIYESFGPCLQLDDYVTLNTETAGQLRDRLDGAL